MEMIASIVELVNKFLWDYPLNLTFRYRYFLYFYAEIYSRKNLRRNEEDVGGFSLHGKSSENGLSSFSGIGYSYCSSGRYRKYCRCGYSYCSRRSRCYFLDVGERIFWNGDHLCRSSYGTAHQSKRKWCNCRRPCLLY